ncbi:hypothetical protein [Aestuariivirga sp.]|uniref:hypothetical protein n=1 Tax=Aestuariivirga sp. TaxID=2650926 RepID=UPI003BAD6E88
MMDYRVDPLWLKLNMMNADGLQAFAPLMEAMQKQMGQNAETTQRVIEEYRKFLFLAMRAGHQVIPPGPVNDAWMMHIQTAQNYWENLGQMIGERPMAQGLDARQFASMADTWKATLESYEKIFGMKPPKDIWGAGPATENPWMQAMNNWKKMFGLG